MSSSESDDDYTYSSSREDDSQKQQQQRQSESSPLLTSTSSTPSQIVKKQHHHQIQIGDSRVNTGTQFITAKNINSVDQKDSGNKKNVQPTDFQRFWRSLGFIFQLCGILAIVFTVFIGLSLDGVIDWNYWFIFSPCLAILVVSLLITSSTRLSKLVSWVIRLVWRIWILGITCFVAFLIVRLQYGVISNLVLLLPLLITFGSTLILGLYSFFYGVCFIPNSSKRKRKYIIGGLPMFFVGVTLTPTIIMIAHKFTTVDSSLSWSVCFVPLFVGDALSSCFVFFLILFSFGAKDHQGFSILQLFTFLLINFCSIVFKILYALKLDSQRDFSFLNLLIPVLVGECFLVFCGLNLLIKPPNTDDLGEGSNQDTLLLKSSSNENSPLLFNSSTTTTTQNVNNGNNHINSSSNFDDQKV
eukprot:gene1002-1272_t